MSQTAPARSPWIEDAWRDLRFGFRAAEPCPHQLTDWGRLYSVLRAHTVVHDAAT
jgi:hypothetical protein